MAGYEALEVESNPEHHDDTPRLLRCMWSQPLQLHLDTEWAYKATFALLALINAVLTATVFGLEGFRYLSNISAVVTGFVKLIVLVELFLSFSSQKVDSGSIRSAGFTSFVNYFQVILGCFEISILMFYWPAAYIMGQFGQKISGPYMHVINITIHLICPIFAIIPVFLERMDFGIKQLIATYLAGFCYIGYMVSYAVRTGEGIYHPLFTFRDVTSYILVGIVIILILVFFYFFKWVNKKMVERYLERRLSRQGQ
jgi:hypothetical protein